MNEQSKPDTNQAIDRLIEQDRIIVEARMLPTGRPLTEEEVASVREAFLAYTHDAETGKKISQGTVAREIDYSRSVLSNWVKGTYAGDVDKVTHAVNLWLERKARREQATGPSDYVATWVCEEMQAFVRLADRHRKMAAIVAPSGSGKDKVIEVLAEQLNAHVLECNDQMTPRQFLIALADELGLRVLSSPNMTLLREINKRLKDRSCLLFLNEAQQLRRKCASVIRSIYDQTGVPIILFGSEDIFSFIDDRATHSASGGGQFWSRCIKCNISRRRLADGDPDHPDRAGRPLFTVEEIRKFLAMKRVRLAREVLTLVWRIAQLEEHGTLRLAMDVVGYAADLWPSEPLTREMILEALDLAQDTEAAIVRNKIDRAEAADATDRVAATAG